MHNAPPVAFPVGRFVWGPAACLLMACLSALGLLVWQMQSQASTTMVWAAWAFWCLCVTGAAVWAPHHTLTDGRLFWSGQAWVWQRVNAEHPDVEVTVGWDGGSTLLLFVRMADVHGAGRGTLSCVWLNQAAMPSKWHGFRCAVYSRPKTHRTTDTPWI